MQVLFTVAFFVHGFCSLIFLSAVGLAQLVERLTAEWEVAGWIPGAVPSVRVLK